MGSLKVRKIMFQVLALLGVFLVIGVTTDVMCVSFYI
jgi:hypothetical protein